MSSGSNGSASIWTWILVAALIVVVGWIGAAVYYEYRQAQQIEEIETAAQVATDEAIAEADARQRENETALSQRMDELDARVNELGESVDELSPPAAASANP